MAKNIIYTLGKEIFHWPNAVEAFSKSGVPQVSTIVHIIRETAALWGFLFPGNRCSSVMYISNALHGLMILFAMKSDNK
jgi:hypothetical protein